MPTNSDMNRNIKADTGKLNKITLIKMEDDITSSDSDEEEQSDHGADLSNYNEFDLSLSIDFVKHEIVEETQSQNDGDIVAQNEALPSCSAPEFNMQQGCIFYTKLIFIPHCIHQSQN